MKNTFNWILFSCLVFAGVVSSAWWWSNQPSALDGFTRCLGEKGATFYGTFWCPHCQAQKRLFGRSERLLPYVECSLPNGQSQIKLCTEKNITGYPTWEFADATRMSGEISLEKLAEKTGCILPLAR